jgi:hypothetical protein
VGSIRRDNEDMNCIFVVGDIVKWQVFVNVVKNVWIP